MATAKEALSFQYWGKNTSTGKVICGGGHGAKHRAFFARIWRGGKRGIKVRYPAAVLHGLRRMEKRARQVAQLGLFGSTVYFSAERG